MKKRKSKLYPSQIRYLEKNPIVSFRLKKEEREKLRKVVKKSGESVSNWVSDFVKGKLKVEEEIEELKKQIERLKKENAGIIRFKVPCCVCGKDVTFSSNDPNWENRIYPILKNALSDWGHADCIKVANQSTKNKD